jgi:hypothetical protein
MQTQTVMINQTVWTTFFGQAWPVLLTCAIGLVIALVMLGRHRTPAALAAIAMALLAAGTCSPLLYNFFAGVARTPESYRQIQLLVGTGGNIARAAGIGLLLWAAFADGRQAEPARHGFHVVPPFGTPPQAPPAYVSSPPRPPLPPAQPPQRQ